MSAPYDKDWLDITVQVATVLGIVATTIGLGISLLALRRVGFQLLQSKLSLRAQLISSLQEDLHRHFQTYVKLHPGSGFAALDENAVLKDEEIAGILGYLGFFEKLMHLLDASAIDFRSIDQLFAFRFFILVNNKVVQTHFLFKDIYKFHFKSIFALYQDWVNWRAKNGLDLPFASQDLMTSGGALAAEFAASYRKPPVEDMSLRSLFRAIP